MLLAKRPAKNKMAAKDSDLLSATALQIKSGKFRE